MRVFCALMNGYKVDLEGLLVSSLSLVLPISLKSGLNRICAI